MSIQINLDNSKDLSLQDVIAYEFFMDHIDQYVDLVEPTEEVGDQLAKLAIASLAVGEIFVKAREKFYKENNVPNA